MRQLLITLLGVFGLSAIANSSNWYDTDPADEPEPKFTRIKHCEEYKGAYFSKYISHDGGSGRKRCPYDYYYIGCEYDYDLDDYVEYTKETCSLRPPRTPPPPTTRRPPPPPTTRRPPPPPPPTTRPPPPPPPPPPCERTISCGYFVKYRSRKEYTGYYSEYYCPPDYGPRSPCTKPYYYRRCEHEDYDDSYYEHPRKFCNVGEYVPPTDPPRRRCVRRKKKKSGSSSSGKSSKKSSSSKSSKSSKSSSSGSSSGTSSGTTSCTTSSGTGSSGSSSGSGSD